MVFDAMSRHQSGRLSLQVFKSHIAKEQGDVRASIGLEKQGNDLVKFSGNLPTIKQATKSLVEEAMQRSKGNQTIAASLLGISQQALSKRIKQEKSNEQD